MVKYSITVRAARPTFRDRVAATRSRAAGVQHVVQHLARALILNALR